jgi:hypothetical protein
MTKVSSGEISNQVLHLAAWPPLSKQWHDAAPHMTRICALLARRPSVGALIPVMLDIPPHIVHSLLEALHASGHIYPAAALLTDQALLSRAEPVPVQTHESAGASFLSRLWQRLGDVT